MLLHLKSHAVKASIVNSKYFITEQVVHTPVLPIPVQIRYLKKSNNPVFMNSYITVFVSELIQRLISSRLII